MTGRKAIVFVVVLAMVASVVAPALAFTGTANASPSGFVTVPDGQVSSDLPENTPMGQAAQSISDAGVMSSKHPDTLDVTVTNPGRAEEMTGTPIRGSGPVALVITDDQNSEGREVALPADEVRDALGHTPEMVYGTHEDGSEWTSEIEYRDGWMIVDIPHFSTNTITWSGEVNVGETFTDGSQVSYDLDGTDAVSDPVVNFTGVTNTEYESQTFSDVYDGGSESFDVYGNTAPKEANVTISPAHSWGSAGNDMPAVRQEHGTAEVNGNIYAIGGYDGSVLASVDEYDHSADSWTSVSSMPTAREDPAVEAVNGKIYAIGGMNSSAMRTGVVEEYDPGTDSWTTMSSSMPTPRYKAASAVVNDKIYVIGGNDGDGDIPTVEVYDPSTDSWSTDPGMPTSREGLGAAAVNGNIYAMGGNDGSFLDVVEKYDVSVGSWTTMSATLPTARESFATEVVDGDIYTIGGYNVGYGSQTEKYDPETDSFEELDQGETNRDALAASSVNGKIHAVGGFDGTNAISTLETLHASIVSPSVDVDGDTASTTSTVYPSGYTESISLSTGSASATYTASGNGNADIQVQYVEQTQTEDPGIEINGNSVTYSGTLLDGEKVTKSSNSSVLVDGENIIDATTASLHSSAPVPKFGLGYSHDAADDVAVDYSAEKFSERYDVSKTYSSDRDNPTLTIPFDAEVISLRSSEYQIDGGTWQSGGQFNGNNVTFDFPDVSSGSQINVSVAATKVNVENGEIGIPEPSPPGEDDTDSKIKVESSSADNITIDLGPWGDGNTAYVYDESWTDESGDYSVYTNDSQDIVIPGASAGDTFRLAGFPFEVSPSSGDVRVSVIEASNEPVISVKPGPNGEGDEVAYTHPEAISGQGYILWSETHGERRDAGVASSPLTLWDDDSEEILTFKTGTVDSDTTTTTSPVSGGAIMPAEDAGGILSQVGILGVVGLLAFGAVIFIRRTYGNDPSAQVQRGASEGGIVSRISGVFAGLLVAIAVGLTKAGEAAKGLLTTDIGRVVAIMGAVGAVFYSGIISLASEQQMIILVSTLLIGGYVILKKTGRFSWPLYAIVSAAVTVLGLSSVDSSIFDSLIDSPAFPIIAMGVVGLAYLYLKAWRKGNTTNIVIEGRAK